MSSTGGHTRSGHLWGPPSYFVHRHKILHGSTLLSPFPFNISAGVLLKRIPVRNLFNKSVSSVRAGIFCPRPRLSLLPARRSGVSQDPLSGQVDSFYSRFGYLLSTSAPLVCAIRESTGRRPPFANPIPPPDHDDPPWLLVGGGSSVPPCSVTERHKRLRPLGLHRTQATIPRGRYPLPITTP